MAVALELLEGPAEIAASQVGPDGDFAWRLEERFDVAGRPRCLDGQRQVARVEGMTRDPVDGLDPDLLEPFALGHGPVVVPAGEQLLPAQRDQQLACHLLGHGQPREPRRASQAVHIDADLGIECEGRAAALEQTRAPFAALQHGPAQARQGTLVGAVGPQGAGELRA